MTGAIEAFIRQWRDSSPVLELNTSGSTGTPKTIVVEKRHMSASARITCDFLGLKAGHRALLCLLTDYIAGKMMVVRALERGMALDCVEPSGHPLAEAESGDYDLVAMVPLQVYNSLQDPAQAHRLRQIRNLIIGGGAIDRDLESQLRDFPHAVWSTYGMTETLSHVALRRLSGPEASQWYTPFDGVGLSLTPEDCLIVDAPAIGVNGLVTNDCVEFDVDGRRFRILGRRDNVVCSGGIKIQIEVVEALLRAEMPFPFMLTWRSDSKFGQALALLVQGDVDTARQICNQKLEAYQRPRYIYGVDALPATPTGKPARAKAHEIAENF